MTTYDDTSLHYTSNDRDRHERVIVRMSRPAFEELCYKAEIQAGDHADGAYHQADCASDLDNATNQRIMRELRNEWLRDPREEDGHWIGKSVVILRTSRMAMDLARRELNNAAQIASDNGEAGKENCYSTAAKACAIAAGLPGAIR